MEGLMQTPDVKLIQHKVRLTFTVSQFYVFYLIFGPRGVWKIKANFLSYGSENRHTVKILGLWQKKLYKGFYAINGVPYICEDDI